MKEVPESVVVLGGGPVGVELAQALRRFGAQVAIVEGQRLLAREGENAGKAIAEQLEREEIDLHVGAHAKQVSKSDGRVIVRLDDGTELSAEKILVATGRRPRVPDLGLENIGLDPGAKNVQVDQHLRAGDNVWAIGDVTGVALFTHVGKYQGRVAAGDMLGKESRADYRALPRVTFCDPQVAGAGLTEEQAAERGVEVITGTAAIGSVARTSTYTREYDELPGFLTLVGDRRRGVLVGAYAVGPEAGEWLGQATLAIRAEVPVAVMRDTIQPFPTFSEIFVNALADLEV
jgi:pyruvate/2-oxoglutarate dehydrogenase complex dihydrolipoamide dehydrogenase (E3) component